MPTSLELFTEHLGLAEVISFEYSNILGASASETLSEARQALFRASEAFKPERGEFAPYAARSVRNALNSLYAKNLRIAQIFPKSLDDPPAWGAQEVDGGGGQSGYGHRDSKQDVFTEVRRRETGAVLEEILNGLSPRERVVVEGMRSGKSLSEIGEGMGISKQAAHKISSIALQKLHERLSKLGYSGLDSKGFLKGGSL